MVWYKDKTQKQLQGGVHLNEAPEFMAVGLHTSKIPRRPRLPPGNNAGQLMAFAAADRKKVYWFLAENESQVSEWIAAICITLPLPPEVPVYNQPDLYDTVQIKGSEAAVASNSSSNVRLLAEGSKSAAAGKAYLGDVSTGLMTATGIAVCGWGSGSGWTNYWNFANSYPSTSGFVPGNPSEHYQDGRHHTNWNFREQSSYGGMCSYYEDDFHDNDFDMDFGGDMGI